MNIWHLLIKLTGFTIIILYFAGMEFDGKEKILYQPDSINSKFVINDLACHAPVKKGWICKLHCVTPEREYDTLIAVLGKTAPEARYYPAFKVYDPIQKRYWTHVETIEILFHDFWPRYHHFIPNIIDYDFSYYPYVQRRKNN